MFCKHDWFVLFKEKMEAPSKRFKSIKVWGGFSLWFAEKLVIIFKCNKCGRLEKFVEENP
jgi:hypothetical protein